ncbi:MAG: DUF374 domain-containing protein [Candidatus Saganbacteria bacterium]|nr:DUF374 domain-containing protein [Candidatus Saganbacteria bacterium]
MKHFSKVLYKIFFEIYSSMAGFLLWLLSMTINSTIKIIGANEEELIKIDNRGENFLLACWHQASFPCFYYYRNRKICVLPVDNLSGEVLARFLKRYGYKVVRIPAAGSPAARTESVLKILKNIGKGYDVGIAVDGPPNESLYKAKPGVLYLAQKSGNPVVPVGMYAKHYITLPWRWDKYIVPLPFTKVIIYFGDPFTVPKDIAVLKLKGKCKELEKKIFEATEKAKKICLKK